VTEVALPMGIGKYVTNIGVIGALAGAYSTARQAKHMPSDWRRYIVWGVWIAGVVLAVASVSLQDDEIDDAPTSRMLP
jgi:hypothetical protein